MIKTLLVILLLFGGINKNVIDNYLRSNLMDYDKFEYRIVNPQILENGNYKIDYSRQFRLKNHYGYIPLIIKKGKYQERTFLTVNLKLFRKAFVSVRKIRRGENVSKADFILKLCDVTNLREKPITDLSLIENSRTIVNIRENSILTNGMIEKKDDVFAGEKITAVYNNGSVLVSFPVVVRSGGKKGETIRVQRKDGIIFKAKVINKNEVAILEWGK